MTNLVNDVEEVAAERPENTAIGYRGTTTSFWEFWSQVKGFAAGLNERGVGAGDRVGIYLPNLPQYVVAFHGVLYAGGIVVPMNPQYKPREIEHLLADSGATLVVTLSDLVGNVAAVRDETPIEHVVSVDGDTEGAVTMDEFLAEDGDNELTITERADDDVAVQPYTSGTTGRPKGVLLTHHNLAWDARASATLMENSIRPDDRFLGVLPLFHIYGMTVTMIAPLFAGAAYYPLPSWDAQEALSLIEQEHLTVVHGVPAMFNDVINQSNAAEFDLPSVRFANSGGGSLPIDVMHRFEELYDTDLYEGYGLTETSPVTHGNRSGTRRPGSIGQPLEGVDAMIVSEEFEEIPPVERGPINEEEGALKKYVGELVVSGPNVMNGYFGLPEANREVFTESGGKRWFHTGDLGYRDEDGFFYVVDRQKHMINTAGYNVYPREVEELLFEHPAVVDAAVVGVPDERRGESIKAFVVSKPGSDLTPEEVKEYCLSNLAEYKHPREVEFVDELPRTTTGKVQKFELRGEEPERTEER